MDIAADFEFAETSEEFTRQAPRLRYVAAINPGMAKVEFVAAAVKAGYNKDTAAIQFAQSRQVSISCGDVLLQPDGRLTDNPNYDWKKP